MKKLLLLAAVVAGAVAIAKSKSDQLKGAAAKVTGDPRVQSALATATEKAAPYVSQVQEKAAPVVSQVGDKVSAATTAASSLAADKLGRTSDEAGPSEPATDNLEAVPSEAVAEVAEQDPVSAPDFESDLAPEPNATAHPSAAAGETASLDEAEFTGFEPPIAEAADVEPIPDPLTDPLPKSDEPGEGTAH